MLRSLFYYNLPDGYIAQTPVSPRDHSKLMYVDRFTGEIRHYHFYDIIDLLLPGDLLVINNSKVIPARLLGQKAGSEVKAEVLLLRELEDDCWECAVRPGKRLREGAKISFSEQLACEVVEVLESGNRVIRFTHDKTENLYSLIYDTGIMPVPPYIKTSLTDPEDYQTVYAKFPGSAAAPTAGFHFTPKLIEDLKHKGVRFAEITLHIGLGTFRPVKTEHIEEHSMHREYFSVSEETAALINETTKSRGRVIAVGTTVCRTLESVWADHGYVKACDGSTDIFIYPGYRFNAVDALITNFHLPESTLIMLVAAFAGYRNTMNAYDAAIANAYRFYSFGDCSLIV